VNYARDEAISRGIGGAFEGPVTVTVTHGAGIDRVGTINVCEVTRAGGTYTGCGYIPDCNALAIQ